MNVKPGYTVQITRRTPQGTVKFVKSGVVGSIVRSDHFEFTEDLNSSRPGKRVFVASDSALPQHMKGWTQETVRIA
jgi:hypothetical protein